MIDYERANRINNSIGWILNRVDQIDRRLSEIRHSPLPPYEEATEGLLEERRQLIEKYHEDLKELDKCHLEASE